MEGLVAENCTVTIPNGATLLLNGEALETESTVEGMRQICQLPQLFAGTYTIGLQHPVYECADIIEYINSGVSFDLMNECTVEASNMQDAAYGDVTGYLSNIFESALSGGTLDRTGVPVASGWESAASDNFRDFQQNCESYVERRESSNLQMWNWTAFIWIPAMERWIAISLTSACDRGWNPQTSQVHFLVLPR